MAHCGAQLAHAAFLITSTLTELRVPLLLLILRMLTGNLQCLDAQAPLYGFCMGCVRVAVCAIISDHMQQFDQQGHPGTMFGERR